MLREGKNTCTEHETNDNAKFETRKLEKRHVRCVGGCGDSVVMIQWEMIKKPMRDERNVLDRSARAERIHGSWRLDDFLEAG